jgi:hypothetical protein
METTQASFDYSKWENLMGEARKDALKLYFDRRLKLEFHGTKVTSDTGLLTESWMKAAEKVEFMTRGQSRSVQKQELEEKRGVKKGVFMQIFSKAVSETKIPVNSKCFWQDYRCRKD